MALPIDLVLVRHGQSEGNAAKRLSEKGDHSAFTEKFRERHTAHFRLTDRGREQARRAGSFIEREFLQHRAFDRYIASEYVRAMETAAHLELPGAKWLCDFYLTERNWGGLDALPENERQKKFGADAMNGVLLRKAEAALEAVIDLRATSLPRGPTGMPGGSAV